MSIKKKIINVVSTPLSYVVTNRAVNEYRASQSNKDYNVLKKARAFDNAPSMENGRPTEAYKARSDAQAVRERMIKKSYSEGFNK